MTQQQKVTLNQWLITLVAAAMGVWGGYKVLQYKVEQNKEKIESHCKQSAIETKEVWKRLEADRLERQCNKANIATMKQDVEYIKQSIDEAKTERSTIKTEGRIVRQEQMIMQKDIKEILKKVEQ